MNSEFHFYINVGSSRKVYGSRHGNVLKIALPERRMAGIMQNQAEYEIFSEFAARYSCFPKAVRRIHDYSVIEVERCFEASSSDCREIIREFCEYLSERGFNGIRESSDGSFTRIDSFKSISIDNSFYRWFAFIFGYGLNRILDSMKSIGVYSDFDGVCTQMVIRSGFSANGSCTTQYFRQCMEFMKAIKIGVDNPICRSLTDFVRFYIAHGHDAGMLFADVWSENQWGLTADGRLVVIDAGYTAELSKSNHYRRLNIEKTDILYAEPNESPGTFNGIDLYRIYSPGGSPIKAKFYTKSEYIIAYDGMSRHIKQQRTSDDGLWGWSSRTVFVEYGALTKFTEDISHLNFFHAVKIEFWNGSVDAYTVGSDGKWMLTTAMPYKQDPMIGLYVYEFYLDQFDGRSGILKSYHPGHDVTYIESRSEMLVAS